MCIRDSTATRRRFASTAKAQLERLRDPSVKEDEKNRIIRSFVEKIVFDRAAASVEIYYYMAL